MNVRLSSETPARAQKAVVFACDGNYAPFAWLAAARIAELAPARDFDICMAAMEMPADVPGLAHVGLRRCAVDTGGVFAAMNLDARRTESSYLRLALPRAFAGDYRRILYLDADVFPQAGDFSALLDVGLGRHAIGAVRDNSQWRTPGRRPKSFQRLGLPLAPYFNSGVLLIDPAAFEASDILGRCLDFAGRHDPATIGLDQDLLNAVMHGDWAELNPVWNWQYTWASRLTEAMVGANIVHFIGHKKPWRHDGGELPLKFRRAYRAFLARHFPEAPQVGPDGVAPGTNHAFLYKQLGKHLVGTGPMSAYLARFTDDLTVLEPGLDKAVTGG